MAGVDDGVRLVKAPLDSRVCLAILAQRGIPRTLERQRYLIAITVGNPVHNRLATPSFFRVRFPRHPG
jgi:hypothetical protein